MNEDRIENKDAEEMEAVDLIQAMARLTEKQKRFVEAYVGPAKGNATEAARMAGYDQSEGSMRVQGFENLTKPNVQQAIEARIAEAIREGRIPSAERVLELLGAQAEGDMGDFVTDDGRIDFAKAAASGKLKLVKKIKFLPKGGLEIELADSQGACALLAKFHGLLVDRHGNADGSNLEPVRYIEIVRPAAPDDTENKES
jgi:phage terminase small subunit